MTSDGEIIKLIFPKNYPAIAPANDFMGTYPFNFMTQADAEKTISCLQNAKHCPKPQRINFTVHWKGVTAHRVGYIYFISKNEVSMIQSPRAMDC